MTRIQWGGMKNVVSAVHDSTYPISEGLLGNADTESNMNFNLETICFW